MKSIGYWVATTLIAAETFVRGREESGQLTTELVRLQGLHQALE